MPRFYFHLQMPGGTDPDDTGIELSDPNTAYLEAYRAIPGIASEILSEGNDPAEFAFEITDEIGNVLWHIPLLERVMKQRSGQY
jgi:hypothetical protein